MYVFYNLSISSEFTLFHFFFLVEHDLIIRNFERHRREGITMERLTYSPHVVDLYAFCGNSILTEFAPQDLSTTLQGEHSTIRLGKHSRRNRPLTEQDAALENDGLEMNDTDHYLENNPQQLTTTQRLDFALQAAKALQALHENDIIHADLTAKQFLVLTNELPVRLENDDAEQKYLSSYRLKVNDFNRCRFVPHRTNSTTEKCTIHIPSAPGKPFVILVTR